MTDAPFLADRSALEPSVAYHGTTAIDQVLEEGLLAKHSEGDCPHIWIGLHITEAAHYGDVVEVDLSQLEGTWPRDELGRLEWHCHYHGNIPASALRRAPLVSIATATRVIPSYNGACTPV